MGLKIRCTLLPVVCAATSVGLFGQGSTATILGNVSDASGAAIPEASIQVKTVGTGATQTVTVDAQGRFRAPDLIVGK